MSGFLQEFKDFALKGNVMDLAIGVIIGGAFGKVVTSLVENIIMPPIGFLIGGVDFSSLAITLRPPEAMGLDVTPVLWKYGAFLQSVLDFLIVAFSIFSVVKAMNHFKKEATPSVEEAVPPPTPRDTELLEAILETLKAKS
ncbi:MAG: large-conductance mechanosensitive channel protein MscL [Vampirovibrionales bacterium]|jgi:large conductance mechanosensitive channel|nr:large-conductance mechanosensitive channel protein MscL [Vampirovibrionales bacterium]